jgi:hypothetical protein
MLQTWRAPKYSTRKVSALELHDHAAFRLSQTSQPNDGRRAGLPARTPFWNIETADKVLSVGQQRSGPRVCEMTALNPDGVARGQVTRVQ